MNDGILFDDAQPVTGIWRWLQAASPAAYSLAAGTPHSRAVTVNGNRPPEPLARNERAALCASGAAEGRSLSQVRDDEKGPDAERCRVRCGPGARKVPMALTVLGPGRSVNPMSDLTPYLSVRDSREAIEWYVAHLGTEVTFEPIEMLDGKIGHCELTVGGATWMMADEFPQINVEAPATDRGAAVTLHLTVDDVDALAARAAAGGATLDRGPEDSQHGRVAVFRDPFGHRWMLEKPG